MKLKLVGVPETLLIPLWARAEEFRQSEPIIIDQEAVNMVAHIDYDFSKFTTAKFSQIGCSVRAAILDNETKKFIKRNPGAIVINLGCGLDTRYFRVNNDRIVWYDIDLMEPIKLRKKFFAENNNYKMISKSIFDFSWLNQIKESGRPVLIIAEGLLMYFSEAEVKELFERLLRAFPQAVLLIEMLAPIMVGKSKKHDSLKSMDIVPEFKWSLKKSQDFEKWHEKIKFVKEWNYFDYHKKRWGLFGFIARLPLFRANFASRIVKVVFKEKGGF